MIVKRRARAIARRVFHECVAAGGLDEERARHLVMQIIESHRRHSLLVLAQFQRLVRLDRARHTAIVHSAVPVEPSVRAALVGDLTRRYGGGLHITFVYEPDLIGGLRIQVGSDIHDGSVRGRLEALAERVESTEGIG